MGLKLWSGGVLLLLMWSTATLFAQDAAQFEVVRTCY